MDFSAQLIALASTAVYAAGNLYARVGLIHSTPLVVTLISLMGCAPCERSRRPNAMVCCCGSTGRKTRTERKFAQVERKALQLGLQRAFGCAGG